MAAAIRPNTKAIYLEIPGNPNSDIPNIEVIAEIAHTHGLPLVIDNTFGTPFLIRERPARPGKRERARPRNLRSKWILPYFSTASGEPSFSSGSGEVRCSRTI